MTTAAFKIFWICFLSSCWHSLTLRTRERGISSKQPFTESMVSWKFFCNSCCNFLGPTQENRTVSVIFLFRQVPRPACLHKKADQQYLLQLHLRDGKTQRGGRAARDLRFNHQWLCFAFEGGAQDILAQGIESVGEKYFFKTTLPRYFCPCTRCGRSRCTTHSWPIVLFSSWRRTQVWRSQSSCPCYGQFWKLQLLICWMLCL